MDLQTLLDLTGRSGPRSYYLIEEVFLRLLSEHVNGQGKALQTHVPLPTGEHRFEADAVAPDGIDDLPGPTLIEIKAGPSGSSALILEQMINRLEIITAHHDFKSALLILGTPLSERSKRRFERRKILSSGTSLVVWDSLRLDELFAQHRAVVDQLAGNIDGLRLDSIVERSAKAGPETWKEVRAEHLRELRKSYLENELSLFLGAGVSADAGVPTWDGLLNGMLATLIRRKDSESVTDEEVQEIITRFRTVDSPSPLMAARYLRRGLADAFVDDISVFLYESVARKAKDRATVGQPTSNNSTLNSLARLCIPRRSGPGVQAVVTYNFDDLFEKQLDAASVAHRPIFAEGTFEAQDELAVYHVHGFLPEDRAKYPLAGKDSEGLVFSEEGYHRLVNDPYSWTNLVQLKLLRDMTCLMVGLSLVDPNLRRLLEVSARKNASYYHYAILPRLGIDRFTRNKDGEQIIKARPSVVERFLSIHHQTQESLFGELGVKIIWIEGFDEIPSIINSVSAPTIS